MRGNVTVTMTYAEASALWGAAGNTVDHPDAMEWMHPSRRAATYRGHDKLGAALAAVERAKTRAEGSGDV
jgi:hypothetical protein